MHLTTLTDYALRLLMHVAQHPDRLCTIAEVAQRYDISQAHLMKVTHRLALCGWIETVRGKGGGMRLARPAADIRLGAVVRDMESDFALVECFGPGKACALDGQCRLAGVLDAALHEFLRHLDGYTLQDILPRGRPRAPGRSALVMLRP
ncbi:MAG: Rrf2 family transcriptional regulator [Burkholderiales bacterium]|nr:Rrf2 family transcriptional regulator [Burkholderiales bacterium]